MNSKIGLGIIAGSMALLATNSLLYAEGGVSGGGGSRITTAFRIRGFELIRRVGNSPDAEKICSGQTLAKTLHDLDGPRPVDQLIDPATKKVVKDDDDAWTVPAQVTPKYVPADMQLLKSTWEGFLNADATPPGRSVDQLILHELLRAAGKQCAGGVEGDKFALSDAIVAILGQSHLVTYQFPYVYSDHVGGYVSTDDLVKFWARGEWKLLCDQKVDLTTLPPADSTQFQSWGNPVSVGNCFWLIGNTAYASQNTLAADFAYDKKHYSLIKASYPIFPSSTIAVKNVKAIETLTNPNFISETRPFLVMIDLGNGSVSYGLYPDKMNPLEIQGD